MEDTLWSSLTDTYAKLPMALTAEKLAEQYNITREQCDEFAHSSQQRWTNGNVGYHNRRTKKKDSNYIIPYWFHNTFLIYITKIEAPSSLSVVSTSASYLFLV